jgi:hypothetical protein
MAALLPGDASTRRSGAMGDDMVGTTTLDVTVLGSDSLARIGDSVLGHAVRRLLAIGSDDGGAAAIAPIAAHDSYV